MSLGLSVFGGGLQLIQLGLCRIQNLLLAARALGLGAAPTTLGLTDPDAVAKVLNLPSNMAAYCLIPVGYPLGNFGPVTRKPVSEIMRFDQWS